MKLRHIGIVTQDIDAMKEYYTKAMKAKVLYDETEKVRNEARVCLIVPRWLLLL